jgi:uncharacterized coiled-coil protein SlyX
MTAKAPTESRAAAKLSDDLRDLTKKLLESNDHSLVPEIYSLAGANGLIEKAKALEADREAQQARMKALREKVRRREQAAIYGGAYATAQAMGWFMEELAALDTATEADATK